MNHPATHPQAPQIVDALLLNDKRYSCTFPVPFGADPCPKNLTATMQKMAPSRLLMREVKNKIKKTSSSLCTLQQLESPRQRTCPEGKEKECRCLNTAQAKAPKSNTPPWLYFTSIGKYLTSECQRSDCAADLRSCRKCSPRAMSCATLRPRLFHWKMGCPLRPSRVSASHRLPFSMKSIARMVSPCALSALQIVDASYSMHSMASTITSLCTLRYNKFDLKK